MYVKYTFSSGYSLSLVNLTSALTLAFPGEQGKEQQIPSPKASQIPSPKASQIPPPEVSQLSLPSLHVQGVLLFPELGLPSPSGEQGWNQREELWDASGSAAS